MVFDHGSQFDCSPVKDFLSIYKVKFAYAAVCHPQSNGQAEAANKQILGAIKKKVEDVKGLWADLIPEILWANRTTTRETTGESPFNLAFGSEAVVPVEVGLPSFRVQHFCERQKDLLLLQQLDFLPEVRLTAAIKSAAYKNRMRHAYNRRVNYRPMEDGDLVLRRTAATGKENAEGKFTATWEGPYQIYETLRQGSYRLMTLEGVPLKNVWNASVLKKYFM